MLSALLPPRVGISPSQLAPHDMSPHNRHAHQDDTRHNHNTGGEHRHWDWTGIAAHKVPLQTGGVQHAVSVHIDGVKQLGIRVLGPSEDPIAIHVVLQHGLCGVGPCLRRGACGTTHALVVILVVVGVALRVGAVARRPGPRGARGAGGGGIGCLVGVQTQTPCRHRPVVALHRQVMPQPATHLNAAMHGAQTKPNIPLLCPIGIVQVTVGKRPSGDIPTGRRQRHGLPSPPEQHIVLNHHRVSLGRVVGRHLPRVRSQGAVVVGVSNRTRQAHKPVVLLEWVRVRVRSQDHAANHGPRQGHLHTVIRVANPVVPINDVRVGVKGVPNLQVHAPLHAVLKHPIGVARVTAVHACRLGFTRERAFVPQRHARPAARHANGHAQMLFPRWTIEVARHPPRHAAVHKTVGFIVGIKSAHIVVPTPFRVSGVRDVAGNLHMLCALVRPRPPPIAKLTNHQCVDWTSAGWCGTAHLLPRFCHRGRARTAVPAVVGRRARSVPSAPWIPTPVPQSVGMAYGGVVNGTAVRDVSTRRRVCIGRSFKRLDVVAKVCPSKAHVAVLPRHGCVRVGHKAPCHRAAVGIAAVVGVEPGVRVPGGRVRVCVRGLAVPPLAWTPRDGGGEGPAKETAVGRDAVALVDVGDVPAGFNVKRCHACARVAGMSGIHLFL
eukprot:m.96491 g.96491  ORF g.96491 m.96491 type:complete len:663 (+) comp10169_c0_seq1:108-2096(+)